jgi:hypothetical protein
MCIKANRKVVGAVVDGVLYDPAISKDTSLRRAKAILSIGGIFKDVQADESDEERRELERLVMNAGKKKEKAAAKEKEEKKKGFWHSHEGVEGEKVKVEETPRV